MIHNTTILAPGFAAIALLFAGSRVFAASKVILLEKHAFSQDCKQFFHSGVVDASKE